MQLIVVLIVRAALERPRLRVSVEDAVGEREVHEGVQQQEVAPEDMEAVAEHSAHEARHAPLPHAPLRLQRAAGASRVGPVPAAPAPPPVSDHWPPDQR